MFLKHNMFRTVIKYYYIQIMQRYDQVNSLARMNLEKIRPAIIEFDDHNDMMTYVSNQATGRPGEDLTIINHDVTDYYYRACRIVDKEHGKLAEFVRICGEICILGAIDHESQSYLQAKQYAVGIRAVLATAELDTVIRRFATYVEAFDELYGDLETNKQRRPSLAKPAKSEQAKPTKQNCVELDPGKRFLKPSVTREIISNSNLSRVAACVSNMAIKVTGVRFEELRKAKPIQSVYKEKDSFRNVFPFIKEEIINAFRNAGVIVEWQTTGKARGTRYVLVETIEQTVVQGQPTEPAEIRNATNPRTLRKKVPEITDRDVLQILERRVTQGELIEDKLRRVAIERVMNEDEVLSITLIRWLESTHGATRVQSRNTLNLIVESGHAEVLYTNKGRILKYCEIEEATTPKRHSGKPISSAATQGEKEPKPKADALDDKHVEIAVSIVDFLAGPKRHVQQGETIKTLYKMLKPDVDERTFRRIIRNLQNRRYLSQDIKANYGKARKGGLIKLRGQDFKNRWNNPNNKQGYISRLSKPLF